MLVFAGGASRIDLEREIERAGLTDAAFALGTWRSPTLWPLLAACDVAVSLRRPTMGETSAIVVRALSVRTPLVVTNIGWFAELSDDVALKVPAGEGEVEALTAALQRLARDPSLRERMGAAAHRVARMEHELGHVADAYAAVCEETAGRHLVEHAVLTQVAAAGADLGITPDAPDVRGIAAAAREVTRGD